MYYLSVKSSFLAVFVMYFLWKLDAAAGIVCYDCNSEYDPRCGDRFDPYTLGSVNCSLRDRPTGLDAVEPTLCRTIKVEAFGKKRYIRSCGYVPDPEHDDGACARRSGTHEIFTTYCSCSTDLCNGGARAAPRLAPLALLACVALAIMH